VRSLVRIKVLLDELRLRDKTSTQMGLAPNTFVEEVKDARVLLVDDDPVLMNALRNALATDLHIIVSTTGGAAGIAEFAAALGRGEPYEAVITDLGMPHMGGREVAAAIKAASPDTPVILLTGWGQRMAAGGDIPKHVDRVLAKPPRLRELRQALAELC